MGLEWCLFPSTLFNLIVGNHLELSIAITIYYEYHFLSRCHEYTKCDILCQYGNFLDDPSYE